MDTSPAESINIILKVSVLEFLLAIEKQKNTTLINATYAAINMIPIHMPFMYKVFPSDSNKKVFKWLLFIVNLGLKSSTN